MTERLDNAPPRPWQSLVAEVPAATPTGGLAAAPEPAASKVAAYAGGMKREDETPADLLATIEYEVSEPATREALATMRVWRTAQRKEMERLDDLDPPDDRSWLRRQFDGFWGAFPYIAAAFAVIPLRGPDSLDINAAISAGAALIAAVRIVLVQSGRTKEDFEPRGHLFFPLFAMIAAPIVLALRLLVSGGIGAPSDIALGGIGVLVIAAGVFTVMTIQAPTVAELLERGEQDRPPPRDADADFYDDVDAQIDALYETVKEQAPLHLRTALADRDPAVARSSRHTVVEAIRVLYEREQIDTDEAVWMLRETLEGP